MAWRPWLDNDDAADDVPPVADVPRAERRTCRDCWCDFFVSPAERRFMKERGLAVPARCAQCRAMRRAVRNAANVEGQDT